MSLRPFRLVTPCDARTRLADRGHPYTDSS